MTRQVNISSSNNNCNYNHATAAIRQCRHTSSTVGWRWQRRRNAWLDWRRGRFKVIMHQQQQQKQHQLPGMSIEKQQHWRGHGNDNGTTELSKNLLDLDAGSFCYNGLADSGCGGSPSPMAMLMSHEDDQALYHTADGELDGDMERLYVKIDENQQNHQLQKQQQQHNNQHLLPLTPSNQVHPSVAITLSSSGGVSSASNNSNTGNSWRAQQQQQQPLCAPPIALAAAVVAAAPIK
ncbi:unnamed protein product [Ceratitis capitata]|uniref:(Mediterranean fruit fly) hypothetical protein n=1 Tax=Ceratitis capitata TaxID=7213 RepID=A0A811URN0_CERCA|nr:unnamed protein product [Ceratitis capitata]